VSNLECCTCDNNNDVGQQQQLRHQHMPIINTAAPTYRVNNTHANKLTPTPCRLAHPQRTARPRPASRQCTASLLYSPTLQFQSSSLHRRMPAHQIPLLHCIALHVHRCATITRDVLPCAHSATQTTLAYSSSSSALTSPITYNAARRQSAPGMPR
jgi:hypothetical protein